MFYSPRNGWNVNEFVFVLRFAGYVFHMHIGISYVETVCLFRGQQLLGLTRQLWPFSATKSWQRVGWHFWQLKCLALFCKADGGTWKWLLESISGVARRRPRRMSNREITWSHQADDSFFWRNLLRFRLLQPLGSLQEIQCVPCWWVYLDPRREIIKRKKKW